MPMFRKKPVVIEAVQFDGSSTGIAEIQDWMKNGSHRYAPIRTQDCGRTFSIPTLEGEHVASPGDWIIKGVAGEFYPCKPAIFEATYESAGSDGMNFGAAIAEMQRGKRVSRSGWNGAGLWLEYIPANGVDLAFIRMSYPVHSKAYPNGARVPWLASQTDMLATDWVIV